MWEWIDISNLCAYFSEKTLWFLQGTPAKVIIEGSHIWIEDPEIVWIDGQVVKVNGNEVEVETSDGRTVN